jgi:hypothetical protein
MDGIFDLGLGLGGYDFQAAVYAQSPLLISPDLVDAYYQVFNPALSFGFSEASSVYDGLDNMNALVSLASGGLVPFVPIF